MRHDLGVLKADLMERFDQNAAATTALHSRINAIEGNVITHCNLEALNNAVAQSQTVLNTVATDVATCRTGLLSVETAITAFRKAVCGHQSDLLNRVSAVQDTLTQTMAKTRQELNDSMITLRSNLLDAVDKARREINSSISTLHTSGTNMAAGFAVQLNDACKTIITQVSLSHAPSHDILNGRVQEIKRVIERTDTSIQNLPSTLQTSMAGAITDATKKAAEDTQKKVKDSIQKLYTDLNIKIQEVQLEMRAGHFNSAARLANKLSNCCTSTIVKLRGIDNLPIHTLPKTYSGLQDLQGKHHNHQRRWRR